MAESPAAEVAMLLRRSRYAVAFTGAGVSAESGIPTFRGHNGLWSRYDPEELASPWGFNRDPKLVWEWYRWRMRIIADAKPNPAHLTMAALEAAGILKAVITQNVDGLHTKAGCRNVIEIHGNIWRVKCVQCSFRDKLHKPPEEVPPRCPKCSSLLRPDVVWFGEPLPRVAWEAAVREASKADLMLVVGTSGVVMPAAMIPRIAWEAGATIIEVNPETTAISSIAHVKVREKAGSFFKVLAEKMGLSQLSQ